MKTAEWFAEFDKFLDTKVPAIIAETATEVFKENFNVENQGYNGVRWPELNKKYEKRITRSVGRILLRNSNLFDSIGPTLTTSKKVTITAGNEKVPYARVHQEGFAGQVSVRPFSRRSGQPVKGHTRFMRMPRRQYMGNTPELRSRIQQRIRLAFKP